MPMMWLLLAASIPVEDIMTRSVHIVQERAPLVHHSAVKSVDAKAGKLGQAGENFGVKVDAGARGEKNDYLFLWVCAEKSDEVAKLLVDANDCVFGWAL